MFSGALGWEASHISTVVSSASGTHGISYKCQMFLGLQWKSFAIFVWLFIYCIPKQWKVVQKPDKTLTYVFKKLRRNIRNVKISTKSSLKKAPGLGYIGLVKDHRGNGLLLLCWLLRAFVEGTGLLSQVRNLSKAGDCTLWPPSSAWPPSGWIFFIAHSWDEPSCNLSPSPPILFLCSSVFSRCPDQLFTHL